MNQKNINQLSFWKKFIQIIKKSVRAIKSTNRKLTKKYPNLLQSIQLTITYFLALFSLCYSLISLLGQIPTVLDFLIPPFVQSFLNSPIASILFAPERTYLVYLLTIEFIIFRPTFKFSLLFKYNLLLIFLLEMIQNLLITYWDLIFTRTSIDGESTLDVIFGFFCISLIFTFLFSCYIYGYFCAIRGKFVRYPNMNWLTDSIAIWLRIRNSPFDERK
jgi:hypothetical protein